MKELYKSTEVSQVRAFVAVLTSATPTMEAKDINLALNAYCVAQDLDYAEATIAVRDILAELPRSHVSSRV